jgi:hypothetical protein
VVVDPAGPRFQTIQGFGGAFTDSAGININSLSAGAKRNLLSAYFDLEVGIGYSLGRVPIGGTDFSTRGYSYLDTPDNFNLSTFKLAKEDFEQKVTGISFFPDHSNKSPADSPDFGGQQTDQGRCPTAPAGLAMVRAGLDENQRKPAIRRPSEGRASKWTILPNICKILEQVYLAHH